MYFFYKILFFNTMMLGTLITISAQSWMLMWIGLEINLLSIIPLMNSSKNSMSTEASIKYFITQAFASIILLASILIILFDKEMMTSLMNKTSLIIMNSSLLTKIGAAPFHFWFPEVIEGLSWLNSLIMLTWQKIAPMIMIMNNQPDANFLTLIILLSMLISSISALNQISLRKIMTFSSINHIGWMIAATMSSQSTWLIYFLIYTTLSTNLIFMFKWTKAFFVSQLLNSLNKNKMIKLTFMLNFFSLGGLPPFLGFLPKWLIIQNLTLMNFLVLTLMMMILTLISIYIYIRLMFSSLMIISVESKINSKFKNNFNLVAWNMTTLMSIPVMTMILISI